MLSTSMPETLQSLLNPEALRQLLTPSDIVILAVLLTAFILGAYRGLVRTIFGFCTGLVALVGASFAAKAAAPYMAQYLVNPIVGEVFQKKAEMALTGAAGAGADGQTLLSSLSSLLQGLLDPRIIENVADPIRTAAAQAAQSMAESLSYFLLFFILLVAFTALLRLIGGALNLIASIGPVGFLNRLAGGILGLICGLALVCAILWALVHFSPATFTELGFLSPTRIDQTLLTKALLGVIAPTLAL